MGNPRRTGRRALLFAALAYPLWALLSWFHAATLPATTPPKTSALTLLVCSASIALVAEHGPSNATRERTRTVIACGLTIVSWALAAWSASLYSLDVVGHEAALPRLAPLSLAVVAGVLMHVGVSRIYAREAPRHGSEPDGRHPSPGYAGCHAGEAAACQKMTSHCNPAKHVDPGARSPAMSPSLPSCGPFQALSAREREVLHLLAQGQSQQRVARELGLKPSTVGTYRSRAYEKLGVSNKGELADLINAQAPRAEQESSKAGATGTFKPRDARGAPSRRAGAFLASGLGTWTASCLMLASSRAPGVEVDSAWYLGTAWLLLGMYLGICWRTCRRGSAGLEKEDHGHQDELERGRRSRQDETGYAGEKRGYRSDLEAAIVRCSLPLLVPLSLRCLTRGCLVALLILVATLCCIALVREGREGTLAMPVVSMPRPLEASLALIGILALGPRYPDVSSQLYGFEVSGLAVGAISSVCLSVAMYHVLTTRAGCSRPEEGVEREGRRGAGRRVLSYLQGRGLNELQARVCALTARGLATGEICEELCVSRGTVSSYRHRAYTTLGVRSRAELRELLQRDAGL